MSLARYNSKRDFSQTAEPRGLKSRGEKAPTAQILFVIQKHAARRLHYDFRLETGGVLKSWALPRGIPLAQGDKRLAVQVEDHPVEYGGFEGTIPEGNYGAGTVMLWDAGICQVLDEKPLEALRKGKVLIHLQGQKLSGHWTLVRMRPREDRDENAWLMIKTEEDADPVSARSDDRSITSGRTMKQIAAVSDQTWQSDRNKRFNRAAKRAVRPSHRTILRRRS
jgi:bifunctional non-homologous end joining protein LigD